MMLQGEVIGKHREANPSAPSTKPHLAIYQDPNSLLQRGRVPPLLLPQVVCPLYCHHRLTCQWPQGRGRADQTSKKRKAHHCCPLCYTALLVGGRLWSTSKGSMFQVCLLQVLSSRLWLRVINICHTWSTLACPCLAWKLYAVLVLTYVHHILTWGRALGEFAAHSLWRGGLSQAACLLHTPGHQHS